MDKVRVAIRELNTGEILFKYPVSAAETTEGQVVAMLKRLARFDDLGVNPEELKCETVAEIPYAKWKNHAANLFQLYFSDCIMLQAYVPTTKRQKPYIELIRYTQTDKGIKYEATWLRRDLPDERDEDAVKRNAIKLAIESLQEAAATSIKLINILKPQLPAESE